MLLFAPCMAQPGEWRVMAAQDMCQTAEGMDRHAAVSLRWGQDRGDKGA